MTNTNTNNTKEFPFLDKAVEEALSITTAKRQAKKTLSLTALFIVIETAIYIALAVAFPVWGTATAVAGVSFTAYRIIKNRNVLKDLFNIAKTGKWA